MGRGQFSPGENCGGGGKDGNSLEKDAGFDLWLGGVPADLGFLTWDLPHQGASPSCCTGVGKALSRGCGLGLSPLKASRQAAYNKLEPTLEKRGEPAYHCGPCLQAPKPSQGGHNNWASPITDGMEGC